MSRIYSAYRSPYPLMPSSMFLAKSHRRRVPGPNWKTVAGWMCHPANSPTRLSPVFWWHAEPPGDRKLAWLSGPFAKSQQNVRVGPCWTGSGSSLRNEVVVFWIWFVVQMRYMSVCLLASLNRSRTVAGVMFCNFCCKGSMRSSRSIQRWNSLTALSKVLFSKAQAFLLTGAFQDMWVWCKWCRRLFCCQTRSHKTFPWSRNVWIGPVYSIHSLCLTNMVHTKPHFIPPLCEYKSQH